MRWTLPLVMVGLACASPAVEPDQASNDRAAVEGPGPKAKLLVNGLELPCVKANVFALDNPNTRFQVVLSGRDPVGSQVSGEQVEVRSGDWSLPLQSSGRSGQDRIFHSEVDLDAAEQAASALGVPVQRRAHLGHSLTGTLQPMEAALAFPFASFSGTVAQPSSLLGGHTPGTEKAGTTTSPSR